MKKTELTDQWLRALRSGDYEQGKGCLYWKGEDGEGDYCCLGVAADAVGELHKPTVGGGYVVNSGGEELGFTLPDELGERFGLSDREQSMLAQMNDTGCDFETIAAYIERRVNGIEEPES